MRIFAIGDIHGHSSELQALLQTIIEKAQYDPAVDHLVLLGDLVDAGPNAREVVEWCMLQQQLFPDTFHVVKGNHDDMFVDATKYACKRYDSGVWYTQGGEETLKSYVADTTEVSSQSGTNITSEIDIPKEHINWLEALPLYWETEEYFFVHGGVPPIPLAEVREMVGNNDPKITDGDNGLLWIRGEFYNSNYEWGKKIIFAHTPFASHQTGFWEPFVRDTMIGINTMPRNDGKLTCIMLPEETFFFQKKL